MSLLLLLNSPGGPGGTAGQPKVRVAGAFATKPLKVKAAGAFATKPLKYKSGGTWSSA